MNMNSDENTHENEQEPLFTIDVNPSSTEEVIPENDPESGVEEGQVLEEGEHDETALDAQEKETTSQEDIVEENSNSTNETTRGSNPEESKDPVDEHEGQTNSPDIVSTAMVGGDDPQTEEQSQLEPVKTASQQARVYVGNLAYETSTQDLKDFMKTAGNIVFGEVLLMANGKSKGCGIIEYSTPEEAKEAMQSLQGKELMGRPVFIREDREAERKTGGQFQSPEGRQIYVSNLPYSTAWQDLKDLFREVGAVFRVEVFAGGSATVCYETSDSANKAIERFDGYEWQGRKMHVKMDERVGGRHHHPNSDRRPFPRRDYHHSRPPPYSSRGGYHRPPPPSYRNGPRRGGPGPNGPGGRSHGRPMGMGRGGHHGAAPYPSPGQHPHHPGYRPHPNQTIPRPYYGVNMGGTPPGGATLPYANPMMAQQAMTAYSGYPQASQPTYPYMANQYNAARPGQMYNPQMISPNTAVMPNMQQQQVQQQQAQQQYQQQAMAYYQYQQQQAAAMGRPPY